MAAEAIYGLMDYIPKNAKFIQPDIEYYPGSTAPETALDSFILYRHQPSNDIEFYMLNTDILYVKIAHIDYDKCAKIVDKIIKALNVEDAEDLPLSVPNIRYNLTFVRSSSAISTSYFSNDVPYQSVNLSILVRYSVLPTEVTPNKFSFIAGV